MLLATASFKDQPGGVIPDFIIEDDFLFRSEGTVNFISALGNVTYSELPTDGLNSLSFPGGNAGLNSPTNFEGQTGFLLLPEPGTAMFMVFGIISILHRRYS